MPAKDEVAIQVPGAAVCGEAPDLVGIAGHRLREPRNLGLVEAVAVAIRRRPLPIEEVISGLERMRQEALEGRFLRSARRRLHGFSCQARIFGKGPEADGGELCTQWIRKNAGTGSN